MMNVPCSISSTVFGKYALSYDSTVVKDLRIDNAEFDSLELLHQFLIDFIKKELLQAISGYLTWRTNRFQFVPDRMECILAVARLKKALRILPAYSLTELCKFILADEGVIDLMLTILPKSNQKTYDTAFKKVEDLENYTTILLTAKLPENE